MVRSSFSITLSSYSINSLLWSFSRCWQPLLTAFPFTLSFITNSCQGLGFSALIHAYKAGMGTRMTPASPLAPDIGRLQSVHPVYPLTLNPRCLPALKQTLSRSFGPNFSKQRLLKLKITKKKRANSLTLANEGKKNKDALGRKSSTSNSFIERKKKNLESFFIFSVSWEDIVIIKNTGIKIECSKVKTMIAKANH